jgi:hypothetical protein
MNLFLKAKHWQLFLLTFGIPILFQIILMSLIFSDLAHHQDPLRIFTYFKFFPVMMLLYMGTLHLFAMFCIFYCIYFVAKTYKTAELQREVSFGDFVLEFFLVWFYPIGVWILQPKINQMIAKYEEQRNSNP